MELSLPRKFDEELAELRLERPSRIVNTCIHLFS